MAIDRDQLRSTLRYEVELEPDALAKDIDEIRDLDAESERRKRRWSAIAWINVLVGGGAALVGLFGENEPILGLGGVLVAMGIVSFVIQRRFQRTDFENRRYELLDALVSLLAVDRAPGTKLSVKLDLAPITEDAKRTHLASRGRKTVDAFQDPWLSVSGRFADGTSFRVGWRDMLKRKRKRATKRKAAFEQRRESFAVSVSLRPKPQRYPSLSRVAKKARGAVQVPQLVAIKSVRVTDQGIDLGAASAAKWVAAARVPEGGVNGAEVPAMLLLSGYQILNLVKKLGS